MNTRELAAQLFLDMVNGSNIGSDFAKQIAISSWELARIFDAQEPKPSTMMVVNRDAVMVDHQGAQILPDPGPMVGCRKCFGSGGKTRSPCKVCHGTGKVPAEKV